MNRENDVPRDEARPASAEMVAAYLRLHPEFFNHYPGLLADLQLPHATGGAVSLFERQLGALREENDRLKARFDELVKLAVSNQGLNLRVHQLALELMGSVGPQAIFRMLDERLRRDFDADRVMTLVFAARAFPDGDDLPQFVGSDAACRAPFEGMLAERKPLCGRLSRAHNAALFDDTALPGSSIVLPLLGNAWDGVLAIYSGDATRFSQDMGTDILTYLGDIVTLVLEPWIAKARPA